MLSAASLEACCFPRASGDGPLICWTEIMSIQFPPRERGWSLRRFRQCFQPTVSPARAGMVPRHEIHAQGRLGFPRASGDGPMTAIISVVREGFPPRERGWSLAGSDVARRVPVSPARAGMVPTADTGNPAVLRFPRASGDGPVLSGAMPLTDEFPPRERGWSGVACSRRRFLPVSPARAGMVPRRWRPCATATRFPRASGDGPVSSIKGNPFGEFPPRERGWSQTPLHRHPRRYVSPARAGMVPR